jgi:hypothetical protein
MTKSDGRPVSGLEVEIKASLDRTLAKIPGMLEEMLNRSEHRRGDHHKEMERVRDEIRRGARVTGTQFRL